jgi:hypothetical protein
MEKSLPIPLFIPSQFVHLIVSCPRYAPYIVSAAILPSTGVSCAMQAKSKSTILNSLPSCPETKNRPMS